MFFWCWLKQESNKEANIINNKYAHSLNFSGVMDNIKEKKITKTILKTDKKTKMNRRQ